MLPKTSWTMKLKRWILSRLLLRRLQPPPQAIWGLIPATKLIVRLLQARLHPAHLWFYNNHNNHQNINTYHNLNNTNNPLNPTRSNV